MADERIRIELNAESITWGDMRLLISLQDKGSATTKEELEKLMEMFDRFVVGGVDAVPLARTAEAIRGITDAVGALVDRKNSA